MVFNIDKRKDYDIEDGIAVIGMSGRFPGAKNVDEFWKNLANDRDTIHTFSDSELRKAGISEDLIENPFYIKRRGVLEEIEYFDAAFFKLTPHQAAITDPQHRLFIEICWEALKNSGYANSDPALTVGVYAGMSDSTYLPNILLRNEVFTNSIDPYQTHIATSGHFLATKVAYHLNLTGPAVNLQTACSTSLVAVVKACQSLLLRECDITLAGGVSIRVPQTKGYLYQEGGIFSRDGKCRAFDKQASGTVSSNGLGVVVLKRLSDALRDEDTIDAIIIGHALNNDGSTKNGYTAPSVQAQSRCISMALHNIDPESISYLETHGTGTLLGDPIEIAALTKAFRQHTAKNAYCAIGSVKTNIGHTDTAAGIASFIKTVLALKHRIIPASLHFTQSNPYINFESSPFYVQKITSEWKTSQPLRRAGVSSFGIGGTNAHVVLQETAPINKRQHKIFINSQIFRGERHWIEADTTPITTQKSEATVYIYQPYWEVAPLKNKITLKPNQTWLVFADNTILSQKFVKQLLAVKQRVFCIYQGINFKKTTADKFYLNPQSQLDYVSLFQALSEEIENIDQIAHFWNIIDRHESEKINIMTEKYLATGFLSIIYFCQAFREYSKSQINFLLVTNHMQKILPDDEVFPDQSNLIAPFLTMSQEYQNIYCKLVDLNIPMSVGDLANALIQESVTLSSRMIVAYRNNIRFLKCYKRLESQNYHDESLLTKNGTYLILGAFGKIGLHIAAYLAENFSAQLVLIGRKNLPDFLNQPSGALKSKEYLWEKIKSKSSSLKIIATDLNDEYRMLETIRELKEYCKKIDGIFHLAAATDSPNIKTLIADITPLHIFEQLAPKVGGVKIASRIAAEIPTRFCSLFSSLSSIIGGVGLTSYIAGNAYLDSTAEIHHLDHPSWISICWDAIDTKSKSSAKLNSTQIPRLLNDLLRKNIGSHMVISNNPLNLNMDLQHTSKLTNNRKGNSHVELINHTTSIDDLSINQKVMLIFKSCLGLKYIDTKMSFYELGGSSLDAISLLELLEKNLNLRLTLNDLNTYNSVEKIVEFFKKDEKLDNIHHIVKLNKFSDNKPVLFLIHPISGTTFCYLKLANFLSGKINCYGVQDPSLKKKNIQFKNIEEMARKYLNYMVEINQNSHFFIGGFSFGGSLAYEITRQLKERGDIVNPAIIIDGWAAFSDELTSYHKFHQGIKSVLNEVRRNIEPEQMKEKYFIDLAWNRAKLLLQYNPAKANIPIFLFKAKELLPEYASVNDSTNYWRFYTNSVKVHYVDGNHSNILRSDSVKKIAKKIQKLIHETVDES